MAKFTKVFSALGTQHAFSSSGPTSVHPCWLASTCPFDLSLDNTFSRKPSLPNAYCLGMHWPPFFYYGGICLVINIW